MSRKRNSLEIRHNPVRSPRKSPLVPLVLAVSLITGTILAVKSDILRQIDSAREGMNKKEDNKQRHEKCVSQCENGNLNIKQFHQCIDTCIDFLSD